MSDANFTYTFASYVHGYGVERTALDGSNRELFVNIPFGDGERTENDVSLLLDSNRLYLTGPSGRFFRIDMQTRALTTLAECVGYDSDDFSPMIGMDETSLYFWTGPDADEQEASIMRVPR